MTLLQQTKPFQNKGKYTFIYIYIYNIPKQIVCKKHLRGAIKKTLKKNGFTLLNYGVVHY